MTRPTREDARLFPTAAEFRSWLETNHETERELFVAYYKKAAGKTAMTYAEAVDEALCFGWIDGITYRIDDELTATRFTPRRRGSYWSAVNIAKVERLLAEGRMTAAGLRAFEARSRSATARYSYENRPSELPEEYASLLRRNRRASAWWNAQAPGYRRAATWWVVSAKQPETRHRRMEQLIADCSAGRPIKQMTYGIAQGRHRTAAERA